MFDVFDKTFRKVGVFKEENLSGLSSIRVFSSNLLLFIFLILIPIISWSSLGKDSDYELIGYLLAPILAIPLYVIFYLIFRKRLQSIYIYMMTLMTISSLGTMYALSKPIGESFFFNDAWFFTALLMNIYRVHVVIAVPIMILFFLTKIVRENTL